MGPTDAQVTAAISALRTDAGMWHGMADELREAARVAGRLDLAALHFSYLGDKAGLTDAYREIQDKLIGLLGEGATNFDSMGKALRTAADGYDEDERNAVHRMRGIY
jgi:hypothetical protein